MIRTSHQIYANNVIRSSKKKYMQFYYIPNPDVRWYRILKDLFQAYHISLIYLFICNKLKQTTVRMGTMQSMCRCSHVTRKQQYYYDSLREMTSLKYFTISSSEFMFFPLLILSYSLQMTTCSWEFFSLQPTQRHLLRAKFGSPLKFVWIDLVILVLKETSVLHY